MRAALVPDRTLGGSHGTSLGAGYGLFAASLDSAAIHAGLGIEIAYLTICVGKVPMLARGRARNCEDAAAAGRTFVDCAAENLRQLRQ